MVENIRKTIDIEVKQKHIDEGIRGSSLNCPITLAMRQDKTIIEAEVHEGEFFFLDLRDDWYYSGYLSRRAKNFVRRFDLGLTVNPCKFRFTLE